jgi:cytochrome c-type biogenesis protein CcmH/NrfG
VTSEVFERGKTFLEKGDFDSAIAAFSEAMRLDPKLP